MAMEPDDTVQRFRLECVHCSAVIARTERVSDADVDAIRNHLLAEHSRVPLGEPFNAGAALRQVVVRNVD